MGLMQIFLNFHAVKFLLTFYVIDLGHATINFVPNLLHGSTTG